MTTTPDGRAALVKFEATHAGLMRKLDAATRRLDQLAARLAADRAALVAKLLKAA